MSWNLNLLKTVSQITTWCESRDEISQLFSQFQGFFCVFQISAFFSLAVYKNIGDFHSSASLCFFQLFSSIFIVSQSHPCEKDMRLPTHRMAQHSDHFVSVPVIQL
jgi:hypothetical protein